MNEEQKTTVTPPPATASAPSAARVYSSSSAHWYRTNGDPCFEVPKADGKGTTKTTLAHARKLNLLPSVTGIVGLLDKPALNDWKIEQACLAILTAPRKPGEKDDAFVVRVLQVERQHEQETEAARDKGKLIHEAIQLYFEGEGDKVTPELRAWVQPAIDSLLAFGERASAEVVLVGEDYAGCTDLIQDCGECWRIWDWKSTKNLPNQAQGAWLEHRLQLSAYAKAFQRRLKRAGEWSDKKPILVGNIYISSKDPGQYVICEHEDWEGTYEKGFAPLVIHWQWSKGYRPEVPDREATGVPAGAPSVEVENMRTHYLAANQRVAELEAKLQEKLSVQDPRVAQMQEEIMRLRSDLSVAQKQASAGKAALASGQPQPQPQAPAPSPAPAPAPAPVPQAPTPPTPRSVPPGKRVVWTEGKPVPQPQPGPMPLQ